MNFLLIPILVGVFGWLMIWGLVKLIFYPIQPLVIGTIKWESFAHKWVHQINLTELMPQLSQNDSLESLKPVINEKLDDFFRHKLSEKLPMISMFIGEKTIEELKGVFMEELAILFPILITQFSANLNKSLHQQWQERFSLIAYQRITKATMPIRWFVFGIGGIWGLLIALLIS
jgi:hypothetical protein